MSYKNSFTNLFSLVASLGPAMPSSSYSTKEAKVVEYKSTHSWYLKLCQILGIERQYTPGPYPLVLVLKWRRHTQKTMMQCKDRNINKGSQRMVWKSNRMIYSYTGWPRYMPAYDTEHGTKSDREVDKGHSKPNFLILLTAHSQLIGCTYFFSGFFI